MNVIILASMDSMDALDHGCTRNMNGFILASMDALEHGCTRNMNVIILASMDSTDALDPDVLDHSCIVQRGCSRTWMH